MKNYAVDLCHQKWMMSHKPLRAFDENTDYDLDIKDKIGNEEFNPTSIAIINRI